MVRKRESAWGVFGGVVEEDVPDGRHAVLAARQDCTRSISIIGHTGTVRRAKRTLMAVKHDAFGARLVREISVDGDLSLEASAYSVGLGIR